MRRKPNISFIKRTFVKQHSQFYCGLACLASLVKYYGGHISQEKLQADSGTTLNGTSLLGLFQVAQKLGFEATGFEARIDDLKKQELPVILHILKDEKMEHFVVCYGYENNKFIIGDPGWGIVEYTEDEITALWKSRALLKLYPGKNFETRKNKSESKKTWFLNLVKDDYPSLGIAAFLGIITSILGLATAIFSQKLIDQILPQKNIQILVLGLIIFGTIIIARGVISYVRNIILLRQSKEMNTRMISSFFGKLLFLPKPFFDSTSTGDMIARMNDARRIQRVVVHLSSQIIIDVLVVLISTGYIFFYSISTGIISLLSVPVFGLLAWHYNQKVIDSQREVMQAYAITESKYIDTIQGIKTIKTFGRENLFSKAINEIYEFFMQKVYGLGLIGAKINLWTGIGSAILLTGVISWTAYLVLEEHLLLGQMMAIITLVGSLSISVINIAMANVQFQEARIAFERMHEFAYAKPEFQAGNEPEHNGRIKINSIEIQNLDFRFAGQSLLLNQFNLRIDKGEMVTIFGDIGCGKSTLLGILQRFNCFESGEIKINDNNWDFIPTPLWRNQIAVVSQNIQLFNGTILENISLNEKPEETKVVQFCREYGFSDFIEELQQAYITIINENSTNLSGGQQQLIALARALYSNPQVLLLDEATASMGRKTESFVIKLLQRIKKDMIIIVVTHRQQLARHADRIYVMEEKTISGSGTHEELLKTNRFYRGALSGQVL